MFVVVLVVLLLSLLSAVVRYLNIGRQYKIPLKQLARYLVFVSALCPVQFYFDFNRNIFWPSCLLIQPMNVDAPLTLSSSHIQQTLVVNMYMDVFSYKFENYYQLFVACFALLGLQTHFISLCSIYLLYLCASLIHFFRFFIFLFRAFCLFGVKYEISFLSAKSQAPQFLLR